MNAMIKSAPVRKSTTVEVPIAKAFDVFTAGFGRWWPATHSIGTSPLRKAVIEPRAGGRWYEIGDDGSECDWGEVLRWEAPTLLVLAWRIGADWRYDAALHTEVEVRFVPVGDQQTRVELEHRLLENMGDAAEAARRAYDAEGGWPGLLAAYQAEVARSA
ncbi:SRPBCC family protein [Kumtagia ephedrae]|uniref:ATPase n=1 Tax=Kumtagia ephedrae TaxID=2116701 RepID=A0A2P7RU26_9HYPH|nr:SRPBCC family protein [Mesorhizobium ephedrae]PSJ53713.1 ATPase [Mesorhizobium ephedrae]